MRLTAPERRVVGCLIEKERATPQGYPLTLNALRTACNQTTNRDPLVDYDDATVEGALASLREQGLTRIVYSTSNRAAKYRHVLDEALRLGDDEIAVVAVLLLRGPQTIGELKGRTERLHRFADLEAVAATLDRLAARDEPLVVRLERRPGQKDARWQHLLGDEPDDADDVVASSGPWPASAPPSTVAGATPPAPAPDGSAARVAPATASATTSDEVAGLRAEVEALRAEVAAVRDDLAALRAELG